MTEHEMCFSKTDFQSFIPTLKVKEQYGQLADACWEDEIATMHRSGHRMNVGERKVG